MNSQTKITLVIMAAGLSTRYKALKQKQSIDSSHQSIIDYTIFDAIEAGFSRILFIINPMMVNFFTSEKIPTLPKIIDYDYVLQDKNNIPAFANNLLTNRIKPWGTGHAIICAASKLETPFAVVNADDFYGRNAFISMAQNLQSIKKNEVLLTGYKLIDTLSKNGGVSRGICKLDKKNHINSITEYKQIIKAGNSITGKLNEQQQTLDPKEIVSMNFWGLSPAILPKLTNEFQSFLQNIQNPTQDEFYLPNAISEIKDKDDIKIKLLKSEDKWFGLTFPEDLQEVKQNVQKLITNKKYPNTLF
ncbi:MAG: sugar phosphate nucleotidyltransferase [Bacteroidales bacterium]